MAQTTSFRVVKEPYRWAVRQGEGVMTPFASCGLAVRHAQTLAAALSARGEQAEVLIEGDEAGSRKNH